MEAVYHAQTAAEAILMVDYLEQRGVDARATNLVQSSVFGGTNIDPNTLPIVWVVNDTDLEKAKALIDEHNERMERATSEEQDAD